jgi:hypothetical protein
MFRFERDVLFLGTAINHNRFYESLNKEGSSYHALRRELNPIATTYYFRVSADEIQAQTGTC